MPDNDNNTSLTERQPVVVYMGGIVIFAQAVMICVMAFGVQLTGLQTAGIMGVITSALALGTAFYTKGKVYPKAELDQIAKQAAANPNVPALVPPGDADAAKDVLNELKAA